MDKTVAREMLGKAFRKGHHPALASVQGKDTLAHFWKARRGTLPSCRNLSNAFKKMYIPPPPPSKSVLGRNPKETIMIGWEYLVCLGDQGPHGG